MAKNRCPRCDDLDPTTTGTDQEEGVVTRGQVLAWMRAARGSAADFYAAVATHFDVEEEEVDES
jgi:hypothetical protein